MNEISVVPLFTQLHMKEEDRIHCFSAAFIRVCSLYVHICVYVYISFSAAMAAELPVSFAD